MYQNMKYYFLYCENGIIVTLVSHAKLVKLQLSPHLSHNKIHFNNYLKYFIIRVVRHREVFYGDDNLGIVKNRCLKPQFSSRNPHFRPKKRFLVCFRLQTGSKSNRSKTNQKSLFGWNIRVFVIKMSFSWIFVKHILILATLSGLDCEKTIFVSSMMCFMKIVNTNRIRLISEIVNFHEFSI